MKRLTQIIGNVAFVLVVLVSGPSFAAPPVQHIFSNGQPADANQVNDNFQELADRIEEIPEGPQGPKGEPGQGVVSIDYETYQNNFTSKVFSISRKVANGQTVFETEVRTYDRSVPGKIVETRESILSDTGTRIHYVKYYYTVGQGQGLVETHLERFSPSDPVTLFETETYTPPLLITKNQMALGQSWNTTGTSVAMRVNSTTPANEALLIESRTVLDLENITVNGVQYQDCLKIEINDTYSNKNTVAGGQARLIQWHCTGMGLVKEIAINQTLVPFTSSSSTIDTNTVTSNWVIKELTSATQ